MIEGKYESRAPAFVCVSLSATAAPCCLTRSPGSSPLPLPVLLRYTREDGKLHTVNLQGTDLADGRTHSTILHIAGLRRDNLQLGLYVNCRLADSSHGHPLLVPLPPSGEAVDIRNGHKAYARLQVTRWGGQGRLGCALFARAGVMRIHTWPSIFLASKGTVTGRSGHMTSAALKTSSYKPKTA